MQILVVSSFTPFEHTNDRTLGSRLVDALRAHEVRADLTMLPMQPDPDLQDGHRLALRLLDVVAVADRMICVGWHSALMRHPDKRVWLVDDDEPPTDDVGWAPSLREAAVVRTASDAGQRMARRAGVPAEGLPVPASSDSWETVLAALAT